MNNISKILKALIEIHNLTQVDFSVKSEIPLPTIKKYLQGAYSPTQKNIKKINDFFNLEINVFLKRDINKIDILEQIEVKYKSTLKKLEKDFDNMEQLEDLMLLNYEGIQNKYFKDNGTHYFDDLEDFKQKKEMINNTLELIEYLKRGLKEETKDKFFRNFSENEFMNELPKLKEIQLNNFIAQKKVVLKFLNDNNLILGIFLLDVLDLIINTEFFDFSIENNFLKLSVRKSLKEQIYYFDSNSLVNLVTDMTKKFNTSLSEVLKKYNKSDQ